MTEQIEHISQRQRPIEPRPPNAPDRPIEPYEPDDRVRVQSGNTTYLVRRDSPPLTGDCSEDCLEACAYPGQFSECEL